MCISSGEVPIPTIMTFFCSREACACVSRRKKFLVNIGQHVIGVTELASGTLNLIYYLYYKVNLCPTCSLAALRRRIKLLRSAQLPAQLSIDNAWKLAGCTLHHCLVCFGNNTRTAELVIFLCVFVTGNVFRITQSYLID